MASDGTPRAQDYDRTHQHIYTQPFSACGACGLSLDHMSDRKAVDHLRNCRVHRKRSPVLQADGGSPAPERKTKSYFDEPKSALMKITDGRRRKLRFDFREPPEYVPESASEYDKEYWIVPVEWDDAGTIISGKVSVGVPLKIELRPFVMPGELTAWLHVQYDPDAPRKLRWTVEVA